MSERPSPAPRSAEVGSGSATRTVRAADGTGLFTRVAGCGAQAVIAPYDAMLGPILAPLANGRRLVTYDMRGRGRSDRVEDPALLGIACEVSDLEAVRASLGIERMALIGHSYLSAVAGLYAIAHPERVERMVLVGAMPPSRRPLYAAGFPPASALLATPGVPHLAEMRAAGRHLTEPTVYARAFMRDFLLPRQLADPSGAARFPLEAFDLPNEHPDNWITLFFEHVFPSLGDWDFRPALASLRVPTLLIHGTKDGTPLDAPRAWADAMPDARVLVVENAGHAPFFERPDVFFPAVERFLGGEWPDEAR